MSKKKSNIIPFLAIFIAIGIILAIFLPTIVGGIRDSNINTPQGNGIKYYTSSTGGNVDIGVFFITPIMDNNDDLVFDVQLNTHSVDLSIYKQLTNFLELRTEGNVIIKDGFIWEVDKEESHHVRGTLKIKNNYNGSPIYSENTDYLSLVFKGIGGITEREHLYKEGTLR